MTYWTCVLGLVEDIVSYSLATVFRWVITTGWHVDELNLGGNGSSKWDGPWRVTIVK